MLIPHQQGPTAVASLLTVANAGTPPQGRALPAARNVRAVSMAPTTTRRTQAVASCLPAVAVRSCAALPQMRRYVARQSRDIARAQWERDELLKCPGMRTRGLHYLVATTAAVEIALLGLTGILASTAWASMRRPELDRMGLAGILANTTLASWWTSWTCWRRAAWASRAFRPAV